MDIHSNYKNLLTKNRCNCFPFYYKNKYYLFDYYNYEIVESNDRLNLFIDKVIEGESLCPDDFALQIEMLSRLSQKNYFFSDDNFDLFTDNKDYKEVFLSFAPIYDCNFRCQYCFGKSGKQYDEYPNFFDAEMVIRTINWFVYECYPNAISYRIDFVSGGEPLLNFQAIKETVECIKKIQRNFLNKKFKIWLCTNGSLIDDNICKYLSDNGVSIGISIDGPKDIHDKHRVNVNGDGTYDMVKNKIEAILCNDNYNNRFKDIWGLVVITPNTKSLVQILEHHYTLGLRSIQMKFVRSSRVDPIFFNESNYVKLIELYKDLGDWLLQQIYKGDINYLMAILNNNDYFGKIIKRIIQKTAYTYRCRAGRSKVTVCPNGDIYPCDSFVGKKDFLLGNINTVNKISNNLFHDACISNREKCCTCPVRYLCGGDCYYNSYINTNDILGADKNFCDCIKELCKIALYVSFEIQAKVPDVYKKIQRLLDYKDSVAK